MGVDYFVISSLAAFAFIHLFVFDFNSNQIAALTYYYYILGLGYKYIKVRQSIFFSSSLYSIIFTLISSKLGRGI